MAEPGFEGDELVPLSVAGAVAYFELPGLKIRAGTEEDLGEVINLAVIALSLVAPILRRDSRGGVSPMSVAQVEELLCAPLRGGRQKPDLDAFFIRRGDLRAALTSLRKSAARG